MINLQAICRFNIATSFPKSQPTATYSELSQLSGISESDVRRIVRGALTNHVFQEKEPGKVSHTAASRYLANNKLARQWVEMCVGEMLPAGVNLVKAMEKWPDSTEMTQTGFCLANNTDKPAFDYVAQFPERSERFGNAMTLMSREPGFGPEALLDYFASSGLTAGTLVDIGGSHGAYSIPLVRRFHGLRAIIQDQADVVETGRRSLPEDVQGRVEFIAHDFLNEQTVQADVYLLRWILHNWPDKYCVKILRALIPALRPGARIVVNEWIVPEPHQSLPQEQAAVRYVQCLSFLKIANYKS